MSDVMKKTFTDWLTNPTKESFQKSGFIIGMKGISYVTLTESKMPNIWYHKYIDNVFCLSYGEFHLIKGSKKALFGRGLGRD